MMSSPNGTISSNVALNRRKLQKWDYFNHSLFNNVYPIYNHALAETRQHPLTTRRYMWKVAY